MASRKRDSKNFFDDESIPDPKKQKLNNNDESAKETVIDYLHPVINLNAQLKVSELADALNDEIEISLDELSVIIYELVTEQKIHLLAEEVFSESIICSMMSEERMIYEYGGICAGVTEMYQHALEQNELLKYQGNFAKNMANILFDFLSPVLGRCDICDYELDPDLDIDPVLENPAYGIIPHWVDEEAHKWQEGFNYSTGEYRFEIINRKFHNNEKKNELTNNFFVICKKHVFCVACETRKNHYVTVDPVASHYFELRMYPCEEDYALTMDVEDCDDAEKCTFPHKVEEDNPELPFNYSRCITPHITPKSFHFCVNGGMWHCKEHYKFELCKTCGETKCDDCKNEHQHNKE